MKTYLNGFLGAGCVVGLLVTTLLFSKIAGLDLYTCKMSIACLSRHAFSI